MGLFDRIKNIMAKPEPEKPQRTVFDLREGDIVDVSLVSYEVVGRLRNQGRNERMITLQDGSDIRYLHIESREKLVFSLYEPIDGRLDSFDEVPTTIDLDGVEYYLEENYSGRVDVSGKTAFSAGGDQHVWQFQSDHRKLLRIEWQDGRFMMYEGESIPSADVQIVRGT
ncbi:DUF4178 domain-containing protein [Aneurinibacillus tyrosinisolvens]|jgi:hypothetical protein|uniref:DUF4178 domain-containing protein n=1 Tax=Aneurinibacillus tyrosinisolvens TaxID=1443435 RepID=UPI00063EDF0F|nr:DUF4178 domain-containing protein [Aneurinibacillus tyrosinisolvens]